MLQWNENEGRPQWVTGLGLAFFYPLLVLAVSRRGSSRVGYLRSTLRRKRPLAACAFDVRWNADTPQTAASITRRGRGR
jgi:hypothetical protein